MGNIWALFKRNDTFDAGTKPNYIGNWTSSSYPNVKGNIQAAIPFTPINPPRTGQTLNFAAPTLVYYEPTSPYRPDWTVRMDINGTLSPSHGSDGSSSLSYEHPVLAKPGLVMVSADQEITYTVDDVTELRVLRGKYTSNTPSDVGTFVLYFNGEV